MADSQQERLQRLRTLASRYWLDPDEILSIGNSDGHFSDGASEDLFPYLNGEQNIQQLCLVTRHEDFHYLYPYFESWAAAIARAAEYIDDDIFTEFPILITDLDTGQEWVPVASFSWVEPIRMEGVEQ